MCRSSPAAGEGIQKPGPLPLPQRPSVPHGGVIHSPGRGFPHCQVSLNEGIIYSVHAFLASVLYNCTTFIIQQVEINFVYSEPVCKET